MSARPRRRFPWPLVALAAVLISVAGLVSMGMALLSTAAAPDRVGDVVVEVGAGGPGVEAVLDVALLHYEGDGRWSLPESHRHSVSLVGASDWSVASAPAPPPPEPEGRTALGVPLLVRRDHGGEGGYASRPWGRVLPSGEVEVSGTVLLDPEGRKIAVENGLWLVSVRPTHAPSPPDAAAWRELIAADLERSAGEHGAYDRTAAWTWNLTQLVATATLLGMQESIDEIQVLTSEDRGASDIAALLTGDATTTPVEQQLDTCANFLQIDEQTVLRAVSETEDFPPEVQQEAARLLAERAANAGRSRSRTTLAARIVAGLLVLALGIGLVRRADPVAWLVLGAAFAIALPLALARVTVLPGVPAPALAFAVAAAALWRLVPARRGRAAALSLGVVALAHLVNGAQPSPGVDAVLGALVFAALVLVPNVPRAPPPPPDESAPPRRPARPRGRFVLLLSAAAAALAFSHLLYDGQWTFDSWLFPRAPWDVAVVIASAPVLAWIAVDVRSRADAVAKGVRTVLVLTLASFHVTAVSHAAVGGLPSPFMDLPDGPGVTLLLAVVALTAAARVWSWARRPPAERAPAPPPPWRARSAVEHVAA